VAGVVKETGLETDLVEAELALLLRLSRGLFEVTTESDNTGKKGEKDWMAILMMMMMMMMTTTRWWDS